MPARTSSFFNRWTRSVEGWLGVAISVWAAFAVSAQQPPAPPVLTQVREVLALPAERAGEGIVPVHLRGVVLDVGPRDDGFALHDGQNCVTVEWENPSQGPEFADDVEIEGHVVARKSAANSWIRIAADKVTILGKSRPLPKPEPVTVQQLATFTHWDQWVSVEGVVLQVKHDGSRLTVQLAGAEGWCNVHVRGWPREEVPKDWIGAAVRISGINHGFTRTPHHAMMSPNPGQVHVLRKGVTDAFAIPDATVAQLRGMKAAGGLVRIRGTLQATTPDGVSYVRDAEGNGASFYPLLPLDMEDKSGRYSTPVVVPKYKAGDELEVVGMPSTPPASGHLRYVQVRVLGSGSAPPALARHVREVLAGKADCNLITVQGRLRSREEIPVSPARWRTTLMIEQEGESLLAFVDAPSAGALKSLQVDDLVSLRGIATGPPRDDRTRIWIPSPTDVQSLGLAPVVVQHRFWLWGSVAGACGLALLTWVWALWRSVRHQKELVQQKATAEAAIRELNAGLERRVAERTEELAAARDELTRALEQERELNDLKSRFVTMVSHEFRTPLGITMSAVELMRHYDDRLPPGQRRELCDDIYDATRRMGGLMEQVLVLGRVEAGKLTCRPAGMDLDTLARKLTDESLSITNRKCPIEWEALSDLDGAVGDETLIRHIFSNLISNAVKYSPPDSVVRFTGRRDGRACILTVEDHGIGIPEQDHPKLFEAFHRGSNVGDTPGTGLGLLIVRRCVEQHGGSMEFQSAPGMGTTFTVRLPLYF